MYFYSSAVLCIQNVVHFLGCQFYISTKNTAVPNNFLARFIVIKKCMNKFDCLVNEMLCIQELKPTLNVQSDSLRAKVFK